MMLQPDGVKIWRPRQVRVSLANQTRRGYRNNRDLLQVYVGPSRRDYVPMEDRVAVAGPKHTPTPVKHTG